MPYGLKYKCEFDNVRLDIPVTPAFTLQFWFKDYTGETSNIIGAAVPVLQAWDTDDPKAPIRGTNLTINLINEGLNPLSSFLTLEDDGVKVILLWGTQKMFEGYLLQDDCNETLVEYRHEINLTANDNLGLLKQVPLNHNALLSSIYANVEIQAAEGNIILKDSPYLPEVGIAFEILNHASLNGSYTPTDIQIYTVSGSTFYSIGLSTTLVDAAYDTADIRITNLNLETKIPLLSIIQYCLANTGVFLPVNFYTNLHETAAPADTLFLQETMIDPYTFLKSDDEYEDAYSGMEKILKRFNLTLFQSAGVWNVVRWDELAFYDNLINGYSADADFNIIGTVTLPAPITFGQTIMQWVSAAQHRVIRALQSNKETFNYKQPSQLLRNYNLQQVGNLRTTYTTGSGVDLQTIKEYQATWWYYENRFPTSSGVNGPADYFIRVVYDYLLNEIARYMVVIHNAIHSYIVEANEGDVFKYSYSYRTVGGDTGGFVLIVELMDGTQTQYVVEPADAGTTTGWKNGPGWDIDATGNTQDTWQSVEITSQRVPFDGALYFYLQVISPDPNSETHFKDIRLEYTPSISESTKIIGHTHKSTQGGNVKLTEDEEIFIDSSPRNSLAGTLFRTTKTGLLWDRTTQWHMPGLPDRNLGEITTSDTVIWRRYTRSIFEGTLVGLGGLPQNISLLNVLKFNLHPDYSLIWGKLEIDYRANTMNGTLWEMWRTDETELSYNYDFKYLYDTK